MSESSEYVPSPWEWVRNQVEEYEQSGGERGNTLLDTGLPVIVLSTKGARSGAIRKSPLMRVEHEGEYALVASLGGAPKHPVWYHNLLANPQDVRIQDGPALCLHILKLEMHPVDLPEKEVSRHVVTDEDVTAYLASRPKPEPAKGKREKPPVVVEA